MTYIDQYHKTRMEELRIFLENESWELCPVKSTFQIIQLQEFKAFKFIANVHHQNNVHENFYDTSKSNDNTSNVYDSTFSFDIISYEMTEEDILKTSEVMKTFFMYQ